MQAKPFFTKVLLDWARSVERPMPWKGEKNPYYIWLSEIILQQTRVEQGMAYFLRFKEKYPTIQELASAPEDEVFKLWEGLGYYSRARNLHATAKRITQEMNGVFPTDHATILTLKGVGPYTAAAIASFAYGLPHAVVDGNVYRVLSRYFGILTAIDSTAGKKEFAQLAQELLDAPQAGIYNQAIMDFGALQCTPKKPNCVTCPMQKNCIAYRDNLIEILPLKEKKIKKRERFFNYLVIEQGDAVFLEKRLAKDIWQDLYQFPLLETTALVDLERLQGSPDWVAVFGKQKPEIVASSKVFKQTLSHQKINAIFWKMTLEEKVSLKSTKYIKIKKEKVATFAFPKIIDWYLGDNSLLLLAL